MRSISFAAIVSFTVLAATVPALSAFGQQPAAPLPSSPDAVLGFENASAWQVSTSSSTASLSPTALRTQGASALDLANAGNNAKLVSLPVASTAPQLAGIGAPGAVLAIDVRFPGRPSNPGSLRLSITSPSRGLKLVPLGNVDLGGLHAGNYQTITFPLTDQASKALGGAVFSDLSFELTLTSQVGGEYLFDNLRVRSPRGVTADATTRPPAGYGGSVDLDLTLPDPNALAALEQTFDVGAIQVPDRLHVKAGSAAGRVRLEFGYSPASIVSACTYLPDTLDATRRSYLSSTCTGGPQPGDILAASWVRLTAIDPVLPLRLRAQLARRPLGDQIGSGLIPPMPTFWGDEDTCTAAPVDGQVVSRSQSCVDTLAATSKIVNDYFAAFENGHASKGWVVAPVPETAKRHGDGTEADGAVPSGAVGFAPLVRSASVSIAGPSNASLVDESGHLNPDGLFDAYWALNGGLTYNSFPGSDRATTHLDADFSAHGVIFGLDATVLDVSASADTDTGQTTPVHLDPTSRLQTHLHVLGIEYPSFTTDTPGQINQSIPLFSPAPIELGEIRFWIFKISLGIKADAGLDLSGGLDGKGIDFSVTPQGAVQGSLFGGIDIFVASGGVEANVDMIRVKAPITVSASWELDRTPQSCSGEIVGGLDGDITVSSGGGEVDLVASIGICPFCDDASMTIFDWDPITSNTVPIVHTALNLAKFQLPVELCTGNAIAASIRTPNSDNGVIYGGVAYDLTGIATSANADGLAGQTIGCGGFSWSVSAPDTISGTGCDARVTFAETNHQAQLGLAVTHQVTDAFGRVLTETGSATRTVNVTKIEGVKILSFLDQTTNQQLQTPLFDLKPSVGGYVITAAKFQGNPNPVRYAWTSVHDGITEDICSQAHPQNCVPTIFRFVNGVIVEIGTNTQTNWMPTENALYTITIIATDAVTGAELARDTTTATFGSIVR